MQPTDFRGTMTSEAYRAYLEIMLWNANILVQKLLDKYERKRKRENMRKPEIYSPTAGTWLKGEHRIVDKMVPIDIVKPSAGIGEGLF